jgi:F420H(2)-dependent quinone reductase
MSDRSESWPPRLPPRWFVRPFWSVHRGLYRLSGGRVVVGYFEDGPNLVTMAMNGWGDGEPTYAARRSTQTAVVVFEPRPEPAPRPR